MSAGYLPGRVKENHSLLLSKTRFLVVSRTRWRPSIFYREASDGRRLSVSETARHGRDGVGDGEGEDGGRDQVAVQQEQERLAREER